MSRACERCPCPDDCLGWAAFCAWAAEDPTDETKIRHIRTRSSLRDVESGRSQSKRNVQTGNIRVSGMDLQPFQGLEVSDALSLVRGMKACLFRSTDPTCGCAGGRCALRHGVGVSHVDCMDCLRRYPDR